MRARTMTTVVALGIVLAWAGCGGVSDGDPFAQCCVFDHDGELYMECPVAMFAEDPLLRDDRKEEPLARLEQFLSGCPSCVCTQGTCWDLCLQSDRMCRFRKGDLLTENLAHGSTPKGHPPVKLTP